MQANKKIHLTLKMRLWPVNIRLSIFNTSYRILLKMLRADKWPKSLYHHSKCPFYMFEFRLWLWIDKIRKISFLDIINDDHQITVVWWLLNMKQQRWWKKMTMNWNENSFVQTSSSWWWISAFGSINHCVVEIVKWIEKKRSNFEIQFN